MDTFSVIKFVTAGQLCVSAEDITMESKFVDDLGADSLDMVALAVHCKDELGVILPDKLMYKMTTVGDVVRYIDEHRQ